MKKNNNKKAELLVTTCAKCPFIIHNCLNGVFGFYCTYNHKWLPNEFNILDDVFDDCLLDDDKEGIIK